MFKHIKKFSKKIIAVALMLFTMITYVGPSFAASGTRYMDRWSICI